ncbi:MAG: glycosyltransferase [Erysipelotrichaceae bacterium]|nr:glycosyltransferase [Erysipelotrichaceae bacterium]
MKLLQISNYMYPHIGGIEQVARDIADSLQDDTTIEQKIICFNEDANDGDYTCHGKETVHDFVDDIEVIRCGCFTKISSQSLSLSYLGELNRVLNDFRPDIVIFHFPNPFVAQLLSMVKYKTYKLVVYYHLDITKQKILGKIFSGQTKKLLDRADKIVATSPNYIEGSPYLNKFKDKCVVIPNCIRPERLEVNNQVNKKVNDLKEKYSGKTLCFGVGRHVPYKGFKYLVEASRYLDDSYQICIGSNGPLTDELKKQAQGDSKVEFLGRLSDEDLIAYYKACDIFTFPSITKNEAFGIALAEGMYFEKPAVTFTIDGSGVNYVNLDKVTGFECSNGDSKAFAEAIETLSNDKELSNQYGKAAKERVINNFMYEQFKKNTQKLIDELGEIHG